MTYFQGTEKESSIYYIWSTCKATWSKSRLCYVYFSKAGIRMWHRMDKKMMPPRVRFISCCVDRWCGVTFDTSHTSHIQGTYTDKLSPPFCSLKNLNRGHNIRGKRAVSTNNIGNIYWKKDLCNIFSISQSLCADAEVLFIFKKCPFFSPVTAAELIKQTIFKWIFPICIPGKCL